jgi:hypothetical protein
MLEKYIYLILFITILGYIGKSINSRKENFLDKIEDTGTRDEIIGSNKSSNYTSLYSKELEILDNKEIKGTFELDDIKGDLLLKIGGIGVEFDLTNTKKGITIYINNKILIQIDKTIQNKVKYEYRILFFPIENYMIFMLNDEIFYNDFNKEVGIPSKKIEILLKGSDVKLGKPLINDIQYKFLKSKSELFKINNKTNYLNINDSGIELLDKKSIGDKKTVIWNIEKNNKYYTIKNIINNLYLVIDTEIKLSAKNDKLSDLIILEDNKSNYVIINSIGKVLQLKDIKQRNKWIEGLKLDEVQNIGSWINYGSTVNLANSSKQYISGNLNYKYDFAGSSGLPSVYADDEGKKELIQWTLEYVSEGKKGYYVKEGDSIYIKNNGLYLQIIRGNPTPGGIGMELSLGPNKNRNSNWIIMHKKGSDRLFRKDSEIYLYHPKSESYVYNTENLFNIGGTQKIETIGIDKKNSKSVLYISNVVSLEKVKIDKEVTIDYYRFNLDKVYFDNKDKEWRDLLEQENRKIKENLEKYDKLKKKETEINSAIVKTKENITKIQETKCPPRKLCLDAIDYSCIPQKNKKSKKEKSKLYDVVYVKDTNIVDDPNWINTNDVTKCKTINDYDITKSDSIKNKKYVLKKGTKLKITDFKFTDFPEANDYISIESLPEDKKITDFKISEIPGFNGLELK